MADDQNQDPSDKETTLVPELEEATEGGHNEKRFATSEKTVHLQFESPLPATDMPQAPAPVATPAVDRGLDPQMVSPARSTKMEEFSRAVRHMPLAPPMERKPFWPVALVFGIALGGFQYYKTITKEPVPAPANVVAASAGSGDRSPASIVMAPAPDGVLKTNMAEPSASSLNVPPPQVEMVDESALTYVLKADSDDFNVLVNGKDMPVISGKITLPLKQKLDVRFVRRGYKEIQITTMLEKGGKQDLQLKFEKLATPPEPKRLYQ